MKNRDPGSWWSTPTAAIAVGSTCQDSRGKRDLRLEVDGQLNPTWVEWLMGYPIGWTDIGSENQKESQELGQDKQIECKDSKDSETL